MEHFHKRSPSIFRTTVSPKSLGTFLAPLAAVSWCRYICLSASPSVTEETNKKTIPMILIFQFSTFPISHGFLPFLEEHLQNSLWSWRVKCEKQCWTLRFSTRQGSTTLIHSAAQLPRPRWQGAGGWTQKATRLLKEQAHMWGGILFVFVRCRAPRTAVWSCRLWGCCSKSLTHHLIVLFYPSHLSNYLKFQYLHTWKSQLTQASPPSPNCRAFYQIQQNLRQFLAQKNKANPTCFQLKPQKKKN